MPEIAKIQYISIGVPPAGTKSRLIPQVPMDGFHGGRPQRKKTFTFGHCPNKGGGGLPMPEFFGPLLRSAFLVNKRVYFFKNANVLNF